MRMVRPVILTATLIASLAAARAENRPMDNYRSIIDRNPFGLKPVPPPPPPAPEPAKQAEKPAEFYLTGISTVGYPKKPKRAYLMNKDNSKKDKDKYYTLTLNDKTGDMRLDEVDEKNRRVKITYQDKEMWLSMKDNGVPAPSGGAPMAGVPGMPAIPGMNPMQPGVVPQPSAIPLPGGAIPVPNSVPQPTTYPGQGVNPNRRVPRSNGMGMMTPGGAQPTAAIPGPTVNFGNAAVNQQVPPNAAPPAPQVDPAEQYVRMHLQRAADPSTPPLPTL